MIVGQGNNSLVGTFGSNVSQTLASETPPFVFQFGVISLRGALGSRWGWLWCLGVLRSRKSVGVSLGGIWPGTWLVKGTLTLGFSLLLHLVSKGAKVIKRGARVQLNDMSNLIVQPTQIPNKSLSLILHQITF